MHTVIHTDGGSRGNPGPAAIGIVVDLDGKTVYQHAATIGIATNNVAEYSAVLRALEYLASLPSSPDSVVFYLDSKLVVEQLSGRYKLKNPGLRLLFLKIHKIVQSLPYPITFSHVPREQNAAADALVNSALDGVSV